MSEKYKNLMHRGFFGIGVYHPKTAENIGTLLRSAHNFGASFVFLIGKRYKKQASDTTKAWRHLPLYHYETFEHFKSSLPYNCEMVFIEQTKDSRMINSFVHPARCVYILGSEDNGIPMNLIGESTTIHIDSPMCLNVAVAASIVMFHRKLN